MKGGSSGSFFPDLNMPSPLRGYWFRMLEMDEDGEPYHQDPNGDGIYATNQHTWGVVVWPDSYDSSGIRTFVINQEGVVLGADLGDEEPPVQFPDRDDSIWHPVD